MIARYTQRMIDDLRQHGTATAPIDSDNPKGPARARSRLYSAARRAGVDISTHREGTWFMVAKVKR